MITKGQKVFLVRGARRHGESASIFEKIVSSVGRKYITLRHDYGTKYHKDTLRPVSKYTTYDQIYTDIQEYTNMVDRTTLAGEVQHIIGSYGIPKRITLDQLRRIKSILDETTQPCS